MDFYHSFLSIIISYQQKLNILMTDYFDALDSGNETMALYIILVAFLYGLIHAIGPGHGKMVIASYFLVKEAKIQEAFKAGFLTSVVHTLSALTITTILYLFFQSSIIKYFQNINTNMYKISGIFILIIACYLLYDIIKDRNEHDCIKPLKNKSLIAIALTIGIVPCPGVMTIVLFSMLLGYFTLGVISAIAMSIGMGITISLAAILATKMRNNMNHEKYHKYILTFSYVGITVLFILGIALIL